MQELRLRGNALFPTDPNGAAELYQEALRLHATMNRKDAAALMEENTKSAGNAITCLYKAERYDGCMELAESVLQVNPLIAKAYAFIGRCALMKSANLGGMESGRQRHPNALQYLCRAVYLLPSLGDSTLPFMQEALDHQLQLMQGTGDVGGKDGSESTSDHAEQEPSIEVKVGINGNGVFAVSRLPSHLAVASTLNAFSVCTYTETCGAIVCANCGIACSLHGGDCAENSPNTQDKAEANGGTLSCSVCGLISYCSAGCAKAYREQHKRYECRLLVRLKEMEKALRKQQQERERDSPEWEDLPEEFFAMSMHCVTTLSGIKARRPGYKTVQSHLQDHAAEMSQRFAPLVRLVEGLLEGEETPVSVVRLLGVIRCNALEVCDSTGLGIGQALHASTITSYFNHSCAPNCAMDGNAIVTICEVLPGEELTIAYIPQLYWPVELRREELAGRYFFHCCCTRCGDGGGGFRRTVGAGGGGEGSCVVKSKHTMGGTDPFEAALTAATHSSVSGTEVENGVKADKIENLQRGLRSRAHERYISSVQLLCAQVRSKKVSDISTSDRDALERLLSECCTDLYPFHYLCHELRNTLSFVYAVLDDTAACLKSCLDELLLWESILPGAHPVKRMKVANALECSSTLETKMRNDKVVSVAGGAVLLPLLGKLAELYNV
ncbi:SET domain [Trypanosoma vivax]|uniref:SET domain-containing protein n=1 Tax=Trypanosoma vivax (strain Y486) TaxID=1055687 RepID=G0TRJ7_TRYVY|nr:SET domain [Trypanosoma vivax]CCC46562.1 conserved hypothetical protein [Trypanosoma vivax Y486]